MADLTDNDVGVNGDDSASLLDSLGALREVRVAETQEDMPFPDTGGRLWARFKLTKGSTRAAAVIGAGLPEAMGTACDFLADACVCLYLAHGIDEGERRTRRARGCARWSAPIRWWSA
jgi:hypothetical protein